MKIPKSRVICDLCGSVYTEVTHKIKIKRKWISWGESGWEKIDLCDKCASDMILWMKHKRKLEKMVNEETEKR